jgi:hypothetical protein
MPDKPLQIHARLQTLPHRRWKQFLQIPGIVRQHRSQGAAAVSNVPLNIRESSGGGFRTGFRHVAKDIHKKLLQRGQFIHRTPKISLREFFHMPGRLLYAKTPGTQSHCVFSLKNFSSTFASLR